MFGRKSSSRGTPVRPGVGRPATGRPATEVVAAAPVQLGGPQDPEIVAGHVERLEETLRALDAFTRDRAVPTSVVINPLLAVWDAAHELDPEVGQPVEELLTAAIQRNTLGCDEVISCIQEVRVLALQETVLAQAVGG